MEGTQNDLIDFAENWRTNHKLPKGAALSSDQIVQFAQELQQQIKKLPVTPSDPTGARRFAPDAEPMLYGGPVNDTYAFHIAKAASENSNGKIFYISDTEAGRSLNNKDLANAIENTIGGTAKFRMEMREQLFYGAKGPDGVRSPIAVGDVMAINDFVSQRMVQETAKGNVIALTPAVAPDSVFSVTELPAAMAKPEVTSINGIPREKLVAYRNALVDSGVEQADALASVRELVAAKARSTYQSVEYMTVEKLTKEGKLEKTVVWADATALTANPAAASPRPAEGATTTIGASTGTVPPDMAASIARAMDRAGFKPSDFEPAPQQPNSRARDMALAFASRNQDEAVKQYPELAGAFAMAASMEKSVRSNGWSAEQTALVSQRIRANIAGSIANGDIPDMKVPEKREPQPRAHER